MLDNLLKHKNRDSWTHYDVWVHLAAMPATCLEPTSVNVKENTKLCQERTKMHKLIIQMLFKMVLFIAASAPTESPFLIDIGICGCRFFAII